VGRPAFNVDAVTVSVYTRDSCEHAYLYARAAVQHERGPRRFKCRPAAVRVNNMSSSCSSTTVVSSSSMLPVRPSPQPATMTTGSERPIDLRQAVAATLTGCSASNVVDAAPTADSTMPLFTASASRTITPYDVRQDTMRYVGHYYAYLTSQF